MRAIYLIFILLAIQFQGIAQCCSAGNPVGGDGSYMGIAKNELRVNFYYRYSQSEDYFNKSKKISVPVTDISFYDFQNLTLTYGITNRWSAHSEIGYFYDKTQKLTLSNESIKIQSSGIGDLTFNLRYQLFQTVKPASQLVASGGVRIPVGAFNEEINGITIPVSLQPSSGAFKFNGGVYFTRKRVEKKTGIYGFALFETSRTIEKDYLTHTYGNYFQLSFAGYYAVLKDLTLTGIVKTEWRGKDKRENDLKMESTGSKVVFVCPQVQYSFLKTWHFIAVADFPVYKYVNGSQLTNKFAFQAGIRKDLKLSKSDENSGI